MTKKCPTCGGDGIVISEHTAAVDIERRLRSLVTPGSRSKAFKVEVSGKVAALIAGPGGTRLQELEETTKRRFFLVGKDGEHLDHFKVLDQGPLEKVAPSLPVDVGQEIDLKLGEVGLHDSHAGVGKVENVDVVVGGAAKLVGKKVKVRITALAEGMAWAELLSPVEPAQEPLTAESEAEKPTRVKRSTTTPKKDEPAAEDGDEAVEEDVPEDALDEADEELDTDETGEAEAAEDGDAPVTPKKRTRRGTRGGRNRKKKPATAAGEANGAEPAAEAEAEAEAETDADVDAVAVEEPADEVAEAEEQPVAEATDTPAGPVIHLPDREIGGTEENGDGAAAPKKRTRRGSRGGKNRRKKPAGALAAAAEGEPETALAEENGHQPLDVVPEPATALVEPEPEELEPEAEVVPEPEIAPEPAAEADREPDAAPAAANGAGPAADGDEDWGYTPMSEWGIDDK
jgi:predicted RNA-binding protein with TRAM domain